MVLVILGLWTTQPSGKGASTEHRPGSDALRKGALIGLATVVGFSLGNVCRGYAMRTWNEAVFGTIIASAAALVCQLAATRNWGRAWRDIVKSDRKGMVLFMWCGIATAGGAMFLVSAMHYMEISLATLVTHTTPLMIFPVSLFWFKNREGLSLRTAVGASMVLAGLVLLALR
jgi:drug/metabolite transporter (DMT)-like permease